jgi:cobalt/nickel transport protein
MRARNLRLFLAGGLLVTAGLALVVSGFASSSPDGLERVAEDKGFLETARDHLFADGPLADYAVKGVGNERLGTGLSGLIGVLITFGLGLALFALVRSRRPSGGGSEPRGSRPGRGSGPAQAPGSEPKPTRAP